MSKTGRDRKRIVLVTFILFIPLMINSASTLNQFLPKAVDGWLKTNEDHYYYPESLFEYINGGAELFISYNFKQVISRTYRKSGQPDIIVEIFDMGEAKNAYGVFSQSWEKIDSSYGQGTQIYEGAIIFWKGRYYVSLVTRFETGDAKKALKSMARKIDKAIKEVGELPAITGMIPEESLVPAGILYFHHSAWLNAFYFISDDDILNISDETDALLAKYGDPENRYYLLIIQYPDAGSAQNAFEKFSLEYAPEIRNNETLMIEDGKWMSCGLETDLFICVFNAPDEADALKLLNATRSKYSGSGS